MSAEPSATDNPFVVNGIDMRVLARRQRWVLRVVLLSLLAYVVPLFMGASGIGNTSLSFEIMTYTLLTIRLAVVGFGLLLMRALRTNILVLIICAFLMYLPFINLVIIVMENSRATRRLREAGLKVGLMGISDENVVVKLGRNLCRNCGYNLTGNTSGICPECGNRLALASGYMARPVVTGEEG